MYISARLDELAEAACPARADANRAHGAAASEHGLGLGQGQHGQV